MSELDIGAVDDFPEGIFKIVMLQDREIGILRWRGRWFALRNVCPHLGAEVCAGPVQAFLSEQKPWSSDLTVADDRPVVVCPWHNWEFDVQTGKGITGRERLKTYPVDVSKGRVVIHLKSERVSARQAETRQAEI